MFGTEKVICPKIPRGGWSAFGMALIWIDPNFHENCLDWSKLFLYLSKLHPNRRCSAILPLTRLRWEFELITVASQKRQRETISWIFSRWKLWTFFYFMLHLSDSGRGHGVVAWGKFVASGGEIETVQLETPARRNSTWLKTPTACSAITSQFQRHLSLP